MSKSIGMNAIIANTHAKKVKFKNKETLEEYQKRAKKPELDEKVCNAVLNF